MANELQTTDVTKEQRDLIKRTVAQGATNDELALYFHDCQRRGVHPLDKKIHFTKRKGKYVPIVGIDFLREQAAKTGACAGITDPVFRGKEKTADFQATVTAKRIVAGLICEFTATARWQEYCPDGYNNNDVMWQKMPHVMLGKVAEALALRKAFPGDETGSLYIPEEMDQAKGDGPDLGAAMTQDFPPNKLLKGRLLRIEEPVAKGDPATAKIETDNGIMHFSCFQVSDEWMSLEGCPVEFTYTKNGKFRVLADMVEAKEMAVTEPKNKPVEIVRDRESGVDFEVHRSGVRAEVERAEETISTQDDEEQEFATPPPTYGLTTDDREELRLFEPNVEILANVKDYIPRKGRGPHQLILECVDQDVTVQAWKELQEFDPGYTNWEEIIGLQVIFKAYAGKIYKNTQQWGLDSLSVCPVQVES